MTDALLIPFTVSSWLRTMRARGITVRLSANDRIHIIPYNAYADLSTDEKQFLREHQKEIKAALVSEEAPGRAPEAPTPPVVMRAGLTPQGYTYTPPPSLTIRVAGWGGAQPETISLEEWQRREAITQAIKKEQYGY